MRSFVLVAILLASLAAALPKGTAVVAAAASQTTAVVPPSATSTDPHAQFNPDIVSAVTCTGATTISLGDQQIAELGICGGIQAPINNCEGNPAVTIATSGQAKWTLMAPLGATINVFKGLWEECGNAVRAACPSQTFTGTCLGGTTSGAGFTFTLTEA